VYRGPGLLPGWMDKAARWQNPADLCIIRGWRSGDVVRHPVWFILSWGPNVKPLEAGSSPDTVCVGPSCVLQWEAHRIRDFGP
jgi:hypothetical protein